MFAAIDARALGEAVVRLGGGRLKQDDRLDLAVGLSDVARIGQAVDGEAPLLRIHAASEEAARAVAGPLRRRLHAFGCRGHAAAPDPPKGSPDAARLSGGDGQCRLWRGAGC